MAEPSDICHSHVVILIKPVDVQCGIDYKIATSNVKGLYGNKNGTARKDPVNV